MEITTFRSAKKSEKDQTVKESNKLYTQLVFYNQHTVLLENFWLQILEAC